MNDPDLIEVVIGDVCWCYDGRVLEIFGAMGQGSTRFHKSNMTVHIGGPNRKGKRSVEVRNPAAVLLMVEAEDWPRLEPLIQRVQGDIG